MAKERGRSVIASNRKARHDYHIEDTFEAGLALTGTEVKALRMGRASLVDGFAQFSGNERLREFADYFNHSRVPQRHLDQPLPAPPPEAAPAPR